MKDIIVTPLKRIPHPQGDILHALKAGEKEFKTFGEAYFSVVNPQEVKGWKKHTRMTLNLIVPVGAVKFVIFDDREESDTKGEFFEIELSADNNYQRLTVGPGLWMAFQGIGTETNMLLNIASIEHDPAEAMKLDTKNDLIVYDWNSNG
jgi:dTDP-4-dehydrorhamnose 3,5-epimerase